MVKIVTDSASDLPPEIAQKLNMTIVPLLVNLEGIIYQDRIDISPKEFYHKISRENIIPTTSQVGPQDFYNCFKQLVEAGHQVLVISFSSRLSGTYQSALLAKDMLQTDLIEVVDTKCASIGQGLIALEAAQLAQSGAPLAEIKSRVRYMAEKMEHIFVVGSLDMLKKGGRINSAQAVIGGLLNIKPILQFNEGAIEPLTKARGWKKALETMVKIMAERGHNLEQQRIGISHSNCPEIAEQLKGIVAEKFGVRDFFISEIGPVIGSHVGQETLALFFLK
ncbi:DegV family protein [Bacillota bacterium LX-D]|nr:DegV family protein [Bacillota bacterium LX-D]